MSNVKFFTVDPYFGVGFSRDTQKVLKIAHFCVSSHIGGVAQWANLGHHVVELDKC